MYINWKFIAAAIAALTVFGLIMAYKYTGDFSGIATWGTSGRDTKQ